MDANGYSEITLRTKLDTKYGLKEEKTADSSNA